MAVDTFLKIGDIKGESHDEKHPNEIEVLAWSWGLTAGAGEAAGKVNVQGITMTKYVDSASTGLVLAGCKGTHIKEAKLTVRKAGDKPLEYIKITLNDVLVTSLQTGGAGGMGRLTEKLTLNFSKFKVEYTAQTATGGAGATSTAAWDIPANKPLG